ncbi:SRPBCC family protein [Nocardia sp. NEAU-G5]|uniref:SRPBCC family protein n=1 Tax=Nocardia albiluteola TaxID=2842303 RepID=A0ABS6AUC7_9NOCA|nr:SRPBCC family protein [Nocardia albiluteola]MBU3061632.1 SRPBCC family protein [Nocardia albiluteola]
MGHIEYTRKMTATPEALWAMVGNPNTWGDWFSIHERWMEEPPATLTVGGTLVAKVVMLGMANKFEWNVLAVQEPSTLTLGATGMAGVKVEFTFDISGDDEGSELSLRGDFEGALIKGALGKAVEKDGMKQLETSLEALDNLASAS